MTAVAVGKVGSMRIGIVGTGHMAEALASRWREAGHELFIGGRDREKASSLARRLGAEVPSGTLREAATFGEVVLLAVWPTAVLSALVQAGAAEGTLAGRVVIDCNNPVETESFTLTTGEVSLAELIARLSPGASVVKAFNQAHAEVWKTPSPEFDGRALTVPLCGDDRDAKAIAAGLVRDLGCIPLDVGPLHRARHIEAMAALVITLLFSGADPHTVFNLVDHSAVASPQAR